MAKGHLWAVLGRTETDSASGSNSGRCRQGVGAGVLGSRLSGCFADCADPAPGGSATSGTMMTARRPMGPAVPGGRLDRLTEAQRLLRELRRVLT